METTMEKVGLCSSTHQPFRAVVSVAARVEANRWTGSYGGLKHLPIIRAPGWGKAQGGEKYVTSDSGVEEARTLIRFLWGDSRERTSWCDLEPLHCPGTRDGDTRNAAVKVRLTGRVRCTKFQRCSLNITWQTLTFRILDLHGKQ